ncbi:alpha/beta hydrolase [Sesbania bispinosa]|nr:alpha/beta hydrolase [Sesbania bispinosa]
MRTITMVEPSPLGSTSHHLGLHAADLRSTSNHIEVKLLPVDYHILSAPQSTPKLHRTKILQLS